ncbi:cysteine and histidine-rich domain-containing protein 1-like [Argonauta hians]
MVMCYNRKCGQDFDPEQNSDDACLYHPGEPSFHEGTKKWPCCNKSSSDFTVFLDFPGCKRGRHNPTPLPKPETPKIQEIPLPVSPVVVVQRPPSNASKVQLKMVVREGLQTSLQKMMQELDLQTNSNDTSSEVPLGTQCNNAGCSKEFQGESSKDEECIHHPGTPVFHEGLKYWSCCLVKTTDFTSFMSQPGCHRGKHSWKKKVADDKTCRYDWHQTGGKVMLTIYAKLAHPLQSKIRANQVSCDISLKYEAGQFSFDKQLELCGIIDPDQSEVEFTEKKVEIKLHKVDSSAWASLELKTDPSPSS